MNAKGAPPDEFTIKKELLLDIVSMPHFAVNKSTQHTPVWYRQFLEHAYK